MKFPTWEEIGKKVAEEALDTYVYKGKTLREWIDILAQTQWIPVSERLPEDSGNYLIAIADSNYPNGQYFKISWFYPSNKEWSYRNAAVIAWMPLPEPYKAESEGYDCQTWNRIEIGDIIEDAPTIIEADKEE